MRGALPEEYLNQNFDEQCLGQGARWTPDKNAAIPQWDVGFGNRQISVIPQSMSESHSVRIFRFVLKRKIDEIHSKPKCLLEIKTYQKDISVQFCLECISSNFLLKQDETHPGGVL